MERLRFSNTVCEPHVYTCPFDLASYKNYKNSKEFLVFL